MTKHNAPAEIANRRCEKCKDNKLYTSRDLYNHRIMEHLQATITSMNGKKLRFTRRIEDGLFPCACGKLLTYVNTKKHPLNCTVCHEVVTKARDDEPIDVGSAASPSSITWTQSASLRCNKCNDNKLYTSDGIRSHRLMEHQENVIVTVNRKQLRFKRRQKDKLFPCACGKLLNAKTIYMHAPYCVRCKALAAKARGNGSINVNPPSANAVAAINTQPATPTDPLEDSDIFSEPEELQPVGFVIHREHKIILCKECKTIVLPKYMKFHFKKEPHASASDPVEINTAIDYIEGREDLLSVEQINNWIDDLLDKQENGPAIPRISILPLYESGFKCSNCGFATINELRAKNHIRNESCLAADASVLSNITLQQFGKGDKLLKWIHVDTTIPDLRQQSPLTDIGTDSVILDSTEIDPSAEQPQKPPLWIHKLHWDVLSEQLKESGYSNEITNALKIPHDSSSLESWLIHKLAEAIFEMEQQEVTERNKTLLESVYSIRTALDDGSEYLIKRQAMSTESSKNNCIMVAAKMIYGLVQLNRDPNYSSFTSQSDELRQTVLSFSALVDDIVEIIRINRYNSRGLQDVMGRIDDEDYFTGLLYVIRIMRLLWIARVDDVEPPMINNTVCRLLFLVCLKEDEQLKPNEVSTAIDCLEYWAHITVDIHLQLQLSAWKERTKPNTLLPEKERRHRRLITDLWWDILGASEQGSKDVQMYLEKTATQTPRRSPTGIIENTLLYIKSGLPTPFDVLQTAKDIVEGE